MDESQNLNYEDGKCLTLVLIDDASNFKWNSDDFGLHKELEENVGRKTKTLNLKQTPQTVSRIGEQVTGKQCRIKEKMETVRNVILHA